MSTSYFCDFRKEGLPVEWKPKDDSGKPLKDKVRMSDKTGKEVLDELKNHFNDTHVKRFDF